LDGYSHASRLALLPEPRGQLAPTHPVSSRLQIRRFRLYTAASILKPPAVRRIAAMEKGMNPNPERPKMSWWTEHKSAALILLLFVVGIAILVLSVFLHGEHNAIEQRVGKALADFLVLFATELSIAILVGGIAALFLSLPDARHHIASIVSDLFSEGKIVESLSESAKGRLDIGLSHNRLRSKVLSVDVNLFTHLTRMSDDCLGMPHLHNLHWSQELNEHPSNTKLLVNTVIRSFSVNVNHMRRPAKFNFPFLHEISIQDFPDLKDEEFLIDFEGRIGSKVFSKGDVKLSRATIHQIPFIRFAFDPAIELDQDSIGTFHYKIAYLKTENTAVTLVRYPTLGFTFSLTYLEQFDYTGIFFKTQNPKYKDFPGREETVRSPRGITVMTQDWVLPGEGLFVIWTPKQESLRAVQQTAAADAR
jgi:hypothetical protein